jgi:hypothetical protein
MSNKTPDRFTLFAPDEEEPDRQMPSTLEVVDYKPGRPKPKNTMSAGAYDPYERLGDSGDTARSRKPRVDLRQLSEWIKTTQQVKTLRDDAPVVDKPPKKR